MWRVAAFGVSNLRHLVRFWPKTSRNATLKSLESEISVWYFVRFSAKTSPKALKLTKNLPEFYRDILNSWYSIVMNTETTRLTPNDLGEQIIWGNRFITSNNKVLFFPEWIAADIIYVADVFKNGIFIKYDYLMPVTMFIVFS